MKQILFFLLFAASTLCAVDLPLSQRGETTIPAANDYTWWLDADDASVLKKISWANLFRSPVMITPNIGAATATSVNGLTITTSSGTVTIANGKTFTASNTLTLTGTDGSTLNIGGGGTLGTAAFTAATAYQPADPELDAWALKTAPSGTAVGTTDIQTLTGKTITTADNVLPAEIGVAASDETTAITTGTGKVTFRMPFAMTVTAVRASLTTASSSGTPTIDINEGGTTILSTKLTIDANEKTSTTAATAAVISDASLADDAEVTVDIDVAGTGATGVKIWLIGTK